jgi:hypothetical protein
MSLLEIDSIEVMYTALIGSPTNIVTEPYHIREKERRQKIEGAIKAQKKRSEKGGKFAKRQKGHSKRSNKKEKKKSDITFKIQLLNLGFIFRITPVRNTFRNSSSKLYKELSKNLMLTLTESPNSDRDFTFRIGIRKWSGKLLTNNENAIARLYQGYDYSFRILDSENKFIRAGK